MADVRQFGVFAFITTMAMAACTCIVVAFSHAQSSDPLKFACYLLAALVASPLKVGLPGIEGTLSVNFLFTLLGILELSLPQTLLIGLGSTLTQFYWKPARRLKPVQLLFNFSQVTVSSAAAYEAYQLVATRILHGSEPLALLAAAITHFSCNTAAMSAIIGLTENKPVSKVWTDSYLWSFPYYMVGAAVAGLVSFLNGHIGWQSSLLILPPIYLMYRSYRLHLGKMDAEKRLAEKVSNLHLRTIETLALAIEAKDLTTGEHLQRVRFYAMELASDLDLTEDETEALRAASVLHDIGKLAVPEHIITKPGKLTPYEFEKMKIHPVVGAEILEQVQFPYPVVPVVRAHHEKWNGSGYPHGLKGEEIPIGARILAVVDCFDALVSDRQYRKALPLDEAMAKVASEAGTSFDPRVVGILERRYAELERLVKEQPLSTPPKLSTDMRIERGAAPSAGFSEAERIVSQAPEINKNSAAVLANAPREDHNLFELCHELRNWLSVDDILSLMSARLKRLVPHKSLAIYLLRNGILTPELVSGENFSLFSSLRIPLGEGLCGWVAQNCKPIVNGNPTVEFGYVHDLSKYSALQSALAVPLEGDCGVTAVLALYRGPEDAFTNIDLCKVEAVVLRMGPVVERAARSMASGATAGH